MGLDFFAFRYVREPNGVVRCIDADWHDVDTLESVNGCQLFDDEQFLELNVEELEKWMDANPEGLVSKCTDEELRRLIAEAKAVGETEIYLMLRF